MSGFVWSVILVSVLAKVIRFSMPKDSNLTKYVSLFFSLCLTAVIALPFTDVISGAYEMDNWFAFAEDNSGKESYEDIFDSTLDGVLTPSTEEYIRTFLLRNYGVSYDDAVIDVELSVDGDVVLLKRVSIMLRGYAVLSDTGEMSRRLEELLLCEVVISVDV